MRIGDKIKVTAQVSGHRFGVGDVLTVTEVCSESATPHVGATRDSDGEGTWYLGFDEFEGLQLEAYTVDQIREAFAKHASEDSWGVPAFYETTLIAALRGEYDKDTDSPLCE